MRRGIYVRWKMVHPGIVAYGNEGRPQGSPPRIRTSRVPTEGVVSSGKAARKYVNESQS